MATVTLYNNDIHGALRALKKELQKEGVFRIIKANKTFKNNHERKTERFNEIVRRKKKDQHEKKANSAHIGVKEQKPKPFVFKLSGYVVKVYDDGRVVVYTTKNKKVNELMLNEANFDDIESLITNKKEKVKKSKKDTEDTEEMEEK